MRGRLRVIDGESVTWREVPPEYWAETLKEGSDMPIIEASTLSPGSEIPNYEDKNIFFTLHVHHDGEFDMKLDNYTGGASSYFDNCSILGFYLVDVDSMLSELGMSKGSYDIWFCIPDCQLDKGLWQIQSEDDLSKMIHLTCYTNSFKVYTTRREFYGEECEDFSFTQLAVDEREERVSNIMEEFEDCRGMMDEGVVDESREEEAGEGEECDKISFQGDSSNMDSNESEVEVTLKKKKKRIPPPNPPYRTRKRGRYSMLRAIDEKNSSNPPQKKPVICSNCKGEGHNKRTCPQKKVETKEQSNNGKIEHSESASPQKIGRADQTTPRKKGLTGLQKRPSPLKHATLVTVGNKAAENTHGGIINPFKAPIQKILNVEQVRGQKFTSLKNLKAARLKMQKNLGEKSQ